MFLAGYLVGEPGAARRGVARGRAAPLPPLPYLAPMVAMWAIALGIVVVQRDLGAALLFFAVFLLLLYVATGRLGYVVLGLVLFVVGRVRAVPARSTTSGTRVDIWLDPFADPPATGYQIIQALYAFGRGGLLGTGLGAGLPTVGGSLPIPAVHTDFPFAALGEELGLVGSSAILGLYLVVIERGLRIAASAADDFRSLLAAGLALVVGVQAFIIAAGNLKLIPLTGITLPFISYGGSSLLVNGDRRRPAPGAVRQAASSRPRRRGRAAPPVRRVARRLGRRPRRRRCPRPDAACRTPASRGRSARRPDIGHVGVALTVAFAILAVGAGYWQVVRSEDLSTAPDNPAVIAAARNVVRGEIVDRDGKVLATNAATRTASRTGSTRDGRSAPSSATPSRQLRDGRARADVRRGADRPHRRPTRSRDLLKKFEPDPYDPQTLTLVARPRRCSGRGRGARRATAARS